MCDFHMTSDVVEIIPVAILTHCFGCAVSWEEACCWLEQSKELRKGSEILVS